MIYPYISKIKSLEKKENYSICNLINDEKVVLGIDSFKDQEVLCIPKDTVLSYEFLQEFDYLYNYVDDKFKVCSYEYTDNITLDHVGIPLDFFSFKADINLEKIRKFEINKPIKGFYTNSNEVLLIAPDYSVDSINYEFRPSSWDETDSLYSTESAVQHKQVYLTQEQVDKLLEIRDYKEFKEKNINERDWLISIFSHKREMKPDGKGFNVLPPLIPIEGYFNLPANTLPNQPETILTTAGLYIFNMYVIAAAFKHKVPYINHELNAGDLDDLNSDIASLMLENKLEIKDEVEIYQNNCTFISYLTEMLMPGLSLELIKELPEVEKKKNELKKKFKDEIEAGDAGFYADNIEKPLLEEAKKILEHDESWDIYSIKKKPTFDNNYKSNLVSVGPIRNSITDNFDIITNSYGEGVEMDKYQAYCNQLISGTSSRSLATARGGYMTKLCFSAFSNIPVDDYGSDCGTKKYLEMTLSKDDAKFLLYSYIIDPKDSKKVIELTPENIKDYIGRDIKLRSPLYCLAKGKYCNHCFGNLYNRMGIQNMSLTLGRIGNSILYISMKAFHDQSIKTYNLNLNPYITTAT